MKKLILPAALLCCFSSYAGNDNQPVGARSAGIAHASVALSDVWSSFHNQAGLAFLKKPSAGIFYENRFLVEDINSHAAVFAMPFKQGSFGLSYTGFGFSLYKESKIGLGYAMRFGENFSAGVQLDYLSLHLGENYGSRSALAAEAGIQAKITKGLVLGVHVYNPTRAKLADYNNERSPTIMRLGLAYHFSDKVFLSAETQKDSDHKPVFKAGIEYHIIEQLYLRTGVSTNPFLNTFGFGVKVKKFAVDVSSSIHSRLGFSPQLGLNYEF